MRTRLVPTLLAGLVGSGLTAISAGRALAAPDSNAPAVQTVAAATAATLPLAQSLALVTLACWGVVLVSRGVVRRLVSGVGLLAAIGTLVSILLGSRSVPAAVAEQLVVVGDQSPVQLTWWFYLATVGAVVGVLATALAVRSVPTWPEMGRRYDAPGSAQPTTIDPSEASHTDLWRAMDEGRDPTD